MICRFCKSEMEDGEIRCGFCGFTHINFTEEDSMGAMDRMLESYKNKKLGGIKIELISYHYTVENGKITENGENIILLADAAELSEDKIKWNDAGFYGPDSEKQIFLTIRTGREEKINHSLEIKIPVSEELKIGVVMVPGLKAKIAAGNPDDYVLSDEFSVLD